MGSTDVTPPPSSSQPPYGMYVVVAALVAVVGITVPAIFHYSNATDVVTALGPATGVIGALVGAYFGIRGASLAQQKANEAEAQRGLQIALNQPVPPGPDGAGQTQPPAVPQP